MLHLYAGVVSGISTSIFGVELAPLILHSLILGSSMIFHFPGGSVSVGAGFRLLTFSCRKFSLYAKGLRRGNFNNKLALLSLLHF
jgi:hypothetical protein